MAGLYNTFIRLKIGDVELFTDHDHIMSCSVVKQTNNNKLARCSITLYDQTALLIEDALLKTKNKTALLEMQYGYVNGKTSPVYHFTVSGYTPQFNQNGSLTITIEGVPSSTLKATQATKDKIRPFIGMSPNEIVKQLCEENNWVLVENVPVEWTVSTEDTEANAIKQEVGMSDLEFIEKKLCDKKYKTSSSVTGADDGEGDYQFILDSSKEPAEAYYGPKNRIDKIEREEQKVSSDIASKNTSKITYNIGRDNERVISFSAEYGKFFFGLIGRDSVRAQISKPYSGERITYEKEVASVNTDMDTPALYLGGSTYSNEDLKAMAKTVFDKMKNAAFQATLEIVGDPSFSVGKYIHLLVLTPQSKIHHTSGMYFVQSVEDTVEAGAYSTRLELIKNAKSLELKDKSHSGSNTESDGEDPAGQGDTWVKQGEDCKVSDCKPEAKEALEDLAAWYYNRTGEKLVVIAGTNGQHAPGGHGDGWKLDINSYNGSDGTLETNDDILREFVEYGQSQGYGMNIEDLHNNGTRGNNFHIDVDVRGIQWDNAKNPNHSYINENALENYAKTN